LWESIAVEATRRSRAFLSQWYQSVFDAPLVRAASLLLGLVAQTGKDSGDEPVAIALRLSQERLAEMLGISRQWATALVRELTDAGIVEWRYGRVTVLDVEALRVLAASGINADFQQAARPAGAGKRDRDAAHATVN
jgi:CRP/FNR family transcriptional regulator, cyclic AMP receptor protein